MFCRCVYVCICDRCVRYARVVCLFVGLCWGGSIAVERGAMCVLELCARCSRINCVTNSECGGRARRFGASICPSSMVLKTERCSSVHDMLGARRFIISNTCCWPPRIECLLYGENKNRERSGSRCVHGWHLTIRNRFGFGV